MSSVVARDPLIEPVEVVIGILLQEQKFLVERRRVDEPLDPGIICLPGGHVRHGESREDALIREMREELGITVTAWTFICRNVHVASNGEHQHAYCYLITAYDGTPVSHAADEILWADDPAALSLEVDRRTIQRVQERGLLRLPTQDSKGRSKASTKADD